MRRLNSFLAGFFLAVAVFFICTCSGYLFITFSGISIKNQANSTPVETNTITEPQSDVVILTTPVEELYASQNPEPATPIPLLPTITPGQAIPTASLPTAPPPPPSDTPIAPTAAATKILLPQPDVSEQLQIVSHQSYVDSLGWYHIVGEVQNSGNVSIEFVEVIAKLYDDTNEVIGTKLTFTAPDIIFPGGKAPFDIITLRRSQWQKIKEYTLQLKGDISEEAVQQNLVLTNQSTRVEDESLYIEGQVQNTGDSAALVKIILTLYDANLNVTNTNWTYADAGILLPNALSDFQIKIDNPADPDNFHYRIQIQEEVVETD